MVFTTGEAKSLGKCFKWEIHENHFTIPYLKFKSGASSVWNGILKALPLLTNGMRRLIGDGNDFLFWLNRWVDERPLSAYLLHELSFADLHKFVENYWTN